MLLKEHITFRADRKLKPDLYLEAVSFEEPDGYAFRIKANPLPSQVHTV